MGQPQLGGVSDLLVGDSGLVFEIVQLATQHRGYRRRIRVDPDGTQELHSRVVLVGSPSDGSSSSMVFQPEGTNAQSPATLSIARRCSRNAQSQGSVKRGATPHHRRRGAALLAELSAEAQALRTSRTSYGDVARAQWPIGGRRKEMVMRNELGHP